MRRLETFHPLEMRQVCVCVRMCACGCVSGCEGAYLNPLLRYPSQLSCSPPHPGLLSTIILVVISTCRRTLRPGDVGHSHWMLPVLAPSVTQSIPLCPGPR